MGKTSTVSQMAWKSRNYDRINFYLKIGDREKLKREAEANGVSVSRFIIDSINARVPGLLSPLDDTSKMKKVQADPE